MIALTASQRSLLGAFSAFFVYGAWAFFINHHHGYDVGMKAALTQGSYSFVVTLVLSLLMEALFANLSRPYAKDDNRASSIKQPEFWLTILITCVILYSSSWLVNVLAGTPEIFKTVSLGYVFGTFYTAVYTLNMQRSKR